MVIRELHLDRARKYGKDPLDMARRLFTHYKRGLFIDTGVGEKEDSLANAASFCSDFNLKLEESSAEPTLLAAWVDFPAVCNCSVMKVVFPAPRKPPISLVSTGSRLRLRSPDQGVDRQLRGLRQAGRFRDDGPFRAGGAAIRGSERRPCFPVQRGNLLRHQLQVPGGDRLGRTLPRWDEEAQQCGWLKDKYGVSCQVVPTKLGELLSDPVRGERAMKALLQMKKLDLRVLREA
jgi:hypothetical protein